MKRAKARCSALVRFCCRAPLCFGLLSSIFLDFCRDFFLLFSLSIRTRVFWGVLQACGAVFFLGFLMESLLGVMAVTTTVVRCAHMHACGVVKGLAPLFEQELHEDCLQVVILKADDDEETRKEGKRTCLHENKKKLWICVIFNFLFFLGTVRGTRGMLSSM